MPFGDRQYRMRIPNEDQNFVEDNHLPVPDTYIAASERPPYLPYSARALLFGELLPDDLARELGVPVDFGRQLREETLRAETNGPDNDISQLT